MKHVNLFLGALNIGIAAGLSTLNSDAVIVSIVVSFDLFAGVICLGLWAEERSGKR